MFFLQIAPRIPRFYPGIPAAAVHQETAHVCYQRLLRKEISLSREQQRLRMAYASDWSKLGEYVGGGLLLKWRCALLDAAGVLLLLRLPGAWRLFERASLALRHALEHDQIQLRPRLTSLAAFRETDRPGGVQKHNDNELRALDGGDGSQRGEIFCEEK